ncbi:MAG: 3-deoxy-manno-octulosonate-8-phosphatase KdsC [Chromatiales bacterium]|nr:3-deoxy-manno-octulosonate-8-phosphatase KdsC [Chromatiales bacterium]
MQDLYEKAARVKMVIFDVDGVLTDGSLFLGDDGQEYKAFNSKDGHGMAMLQASGVQIGIITGRSSDVVRIRMESLGVKHVYQGRRDKLPAFRDLCVRLELDPGEIAYVGDDVVDLPIMVRAGLSIAVQDAHEWVKKHAHWITPHGGGRGAARDVCELIMDAKGLLKDAMAKYTQLD